MYQKLIKNVLISCLLIFIMLILNWKAVKAQETLKILPTYSGYINDQGYYYVVGEVQNIGTTPVGNIQVNATFYDANGATLALGCGNAKLDVLLPGRRAPFAITLYSGNLSRQVHNYSLLIAGFSIVEGKPLDLEILSNSSSFESSTFRVNGIIKNIGDKETTFTRVVVTFYNESGKVVDALLNYTKPSTISPGETASFEVVISGTKAAKVHHYVIEAESYDYLTIPEFNLTILSSLLLATFTIPLIIRTCNKKCTPNTKCN